MKFSMLLLAMASMPFILKAETVSGTITGEDGRGLAGVTVRLLRADDTTIVRGAKTNAKGVFSMKNIPAGNYLPRVQSVGYRHYIGQKLIVSGDVRFDARLEQIPVELDNLVVTASRTAEKASEAPVSISVVDSKQIRSANAVTPVEHLRGTPGVDMVQSGVGQQTVVTRGFSNVFSGLLMFMTDYRNAGVPSLRANISYLTPVIDADIDHIEIARGPGSALYGPNAANGVVNIITKSPFASQGTTIELTGGEREFFQASARHAGTVGDNFGYKISGNYTSGRDWLYTDPVEKANRDTLIQRGAGDTLTVGNRDFTFQRYGIDGRLDYMLGENAQVTLQGGYAQAINSLELTDLSAGQAKNWGFGYALARFDYDRLMVQGFMNFSNSGQTFLLRSGDPIVDRSKQIVGRIQHSAMIGDMQEFTYGGDMFLTRPATEGSIMGEHENNDDVNEFGAYLQSKTSLFDNTIDVVLAGRYDYHNCLEKGVFSPRIALVLKPSEGQTFRATYNTGYTAPYPFDLFADIRYTDNAFRAEGFPDEYGPAIFVKGVPHTTGLTFLRDQAGQPLFRSTFLQDRTMTLPLNGVADFWQPATMFVADGISKSPMIPDSLKQPLIDLLTSLKPGYENIRGALQLLNNDTEKFDPVTNAYDAAKLQPTITRTYEIGYSGIINEMFRASIDVYFSNISNFITSSRPITPNVFLNRDDVAAYLTPILTQGLGDSSLAQFAAELLAESYGQIPLGTAAVKESADPTAILVAPRNFGEVEYWGSDVALEFRPDAKWTFSGTFSYMNDNIFYNSIDTITLNAPKYKASFSASYSDDASGLNIGLRYRYNGGFDMISGIFNGRVNPYNLLDITAGCNIPGIKGLRAVVSVSNVLDFRHREFVGAPDIGRLGLLKAAYSF